MKTEAKTELKGENEIQLKGENEIQPSDIIKDKQKETFKQNFIWQAINKGWQVKKLGTKSFELKKKIT